MQTPLTSELWPVRKHGFKDIFFRTLHDEGHNGDLRELMQGQEKTGDHIFQNKSVDLLFSLCVPFQVRTVFRAATIDVIIDYSADYFLDRLFGL